LLGKEGGASGSKLERMSNSTTKGIGVFTRRKHWVGKSY